MAKTMKQKRDLRRVEMVAIVDECDFRHRPYSLWEQWARENKRKAKQMRPDQCVLFVAGSGKYLAWVFPPDIGKSVTGLEREIHNYETLFIRDGEWHPYMLQNYGEKRNMDLGLSSFEDLYSARKMRRRGGE